jgi:hypothetical protein
VSGDRRPDPNRAELAPLLSEPSRGHSIDPWVPRTTTPGTALGLALEESHHAWVPIRRSWPGYENHVSLIWSLDAAPIFRCVCQPGMGSGSFSVQASGGIEEALLQQVQIGTAVHLPLEGLEAVDLALGLPVAPR